MPLGVDLSACEVCQEKKQTCAHARSEDRHRCLRLWSCFDVCVFTCCVLLRVVFSLSCVCVCVCVYAEEVLLYPAVHIHKYRHPQMPSSERVLCVCVCVCLFVCVSRHSQMPSSVRALRHPQVGNRMLTFHELLTLQGHMHHRRLNGHFQSGNENRLCRGLHTVNFLLLVQR